MFYLDLSQLVGQIQQMLTSMISPSLQSIFSGLSQLTDRLRSLEEAQMNANSRLGRQVMALRRGKQLLRRSQSAENSPSSGNSPLPR